MDGKIPNDHPSYIQGKECDSGRVNAGFALAHSAGKLGGGSLLAPFPVGIVSGTVTN